MAVHLTKIYTRTGDDGTSGLGDFSRVVKTDPRLVAYADAEEANAAIGVALALGALREDLATVLRRVQNDLFDVGADLCMPIVAQRDLTQRDLTQRDLTQPKRPLRITDGYVTRLEGWCDEFNAALSKLDSFILPGGTPGAALLHTARVVVRRAERSTWAVLEADPERTNPVTARYLNRLSDLLFILCRVANPDGDMLWKPGGDR
jgi:cob(I)alamin adenosyltransferase